MGNVYINEKLKDKKNKYSLQKIKTIGLVAGAGFITIIGLLVAVNTFKNNDFEYQPGQNIENSFTTQYIGWLSEEKGKEVEISKGIADILNDVVPNYYNAKDNYEDIVSIDGVDKNDLSNSSVNVVSSVEKMKIASINIIEAQLKSEFGLSDSAVIEIEKHDNSADGRTYSVSIKDGEQKYYMLSDAIPLLGQSKIPNEYLSIIEDYYELERYSGDGSNLEAWNKKTMKKYIDISDSLLYNTLSLSIKNYQEEKAKNL